MCILLSSCEHPDYPFVLLSNRDEYFARPTALADFYSENREILAPFDLARSEHGTWIGVNRHGRLCVLVNYREGSAENDALSLISRGSLPISFLNSSLNPREWEAHVREVSKEFKNVGGFSLLFGDLRLGAGGVIEPFNIISNRAQGSVEVFKPETRMIGLSNSLFTQPWPKVQKGKVLLDKLISDSLQNNWSQDELITRGFEVLSTTEIDTTKKPDSYLELFKEMPSSIFIPPIKTPHFGMEEELKKQGITSMGGYYGTRTQTIIVVDRSGNLKYIEKTLHSSDNLNEEPTIRTYAFKIPDYYKG
ncbi:unnamed protein product [Kuraishia capsulata CBS 1993]|uniref:Transport and Golgi organization protein 2 n=1 Tax=Kuraishia capsulata CBS 1993 TaxID=1382522 RepID=W6MJN0_9ASCO|nr:uncharacterized protein KUCA_T00002723001 [Kuraishia capsulata CBS 1993]CDK26749.1 unnamed protein product [Kuraishia capsulata CBS 1993]